MLQILFKAQQFKLLQESLAKQAKSSDHSTEEGCDEIIILPQMDFSKNSNSKQQANLSKSFKTEEAKLLEYYQSLIFKSVNQLEIFDIKVQIPEATYKSTQKVHFRNKNELQRKIKIMAEMKNDDIQILADFDHTISSREINGSFNVPTMGLFRESSIMPKEFRKQLSDLFNYYYPIEKDVNIPENEKIKLIEKWYAQDNVFTSAQNITRETVIKVIETSNIGFRHRAPEFLKFCKNQEVNLSVVSGGCSDTIATMIQNVMDLKDYEKFMIYANEMCFDKSNTIEKFDMKINSVGKKLVIDNSKIQNRKNIIIFGDILADVNMVSNVDYDNLICIGFLNKPRSKDDLPQYLEKYDVVIVNDGSFEEPMAILKQIFN